MKLSILAGALLLAPASFVRAQDNPADLIVHNGKVADRGREVHHRRGRRGARRQGRRRRDERRRPQAQGRRRRASSTPAARPCCRACTTATRTRSARRGSEVGDPIPLLRSIPEVLDYIKKRAAELPEGQVDRPPLRLPDAAQGSPLPHEGGTRRGRAEAPGAVPRRPRGHRQLHGAGSLRRHEGHARPAGRAGREGPEDRRADRHAPQRLRRAQGRARRRRASRPPRRRARR